ncbi:MAG: SUMF1/EgtB/PvdO family nonheme iron enzyme [Planctomycetes bacterium]|nr:SUMF1/EgtB/PvdO family nonheme iron enzyme [Planctomycetota bacterium]MCB9891616.1 SUMF1/EgtB/PvdO family nonheme iron enzyme [Planctomycetota bacterium]MCB9917887.1 SUMF1/EgtB/PvdO family nonheme iron enzyme [Planctomycetota bacterium]
MASPSRERVLQEFLARYFADEDEGRVAAAEHYARDFPGHEATIHSAFEQLNSSPREEGEAEIEGFEVLRELGAGGQGIVYLAREIALDRLVAIKVLGGAVGATGTRPWTKRMRDRFEREALIASRLQHPGICPIYSMGTHAGRPYLVMPFLVGRTLQDEVASGPLPAMRAMRIVEDAARALHVAHEAGVVHRDVKASNIFITDDERVVLLDFGIARDLENEIELTMTGDLIGTLPFLSPEQVQGRPVDRRSDVYSLAVTTYEAVTGTLPFDEPTQRALMNAIVHDEPVRASKLVKSIPSDLSIVIETGLEKDTSRRYQTTADFADDLARVSRKEPIRARPAGPVRRLVRFVQRQPKLAASLLLTFVALAGGLAVSLSLLTRVQGEERRNRIALEEIDLLTDRTRLEELQSAIHTLEPPHPCRLDAMRDWLSRADELVERIPHHVRVLEALQARGTRISDAANADAETRRLMGERERLRRSRAHLEAEVERLARTGEDPATLDHRQRELGVLDQIEPKIEEAIAKDRHWVFDNARDRWRHELQKTLVAELEAFRDRGIRVLSRRRIRELYDFARTMYERSIESRRVAWTACIDRVRDTESAPHYAGLDLKPQVGLVPLGPDPESGFEEFVHLQTGDVPERDPTTGKLRLEEKHGIVFVLIPGGLATIGAVANAPEGGAVAGPTDQSESGAHVDPFAKDVEAPVHRVQLDAFLLAKHETTQAQWIRIMNDNPSQTRIGNTVTGDPPVTGLHPVGGLSWDDGRAFLDRCGFVYPTSAQWEYAARAGTSTVFYTGDDPASLDGHANIADTTWARQANRRDSVYHVFDDGWTTHSPIGTFLPNAFGLHDVHGNVMEYCFDKQHRYSFHVLPGDGLRPIGGSAGRVARGGSHRQSWLRARSADFVVQRPNLTIADCGLRPARKID